MATKSKHSIFNKEISDFIEKLFQKYQPKFSKNPLATTDKVAFIDNNIPTLKEGSYLLDIEQKTSENKGVLYTASQDFYVNGPRFGIKPTQILSVFPPAGSIGDHAHVLPHIAFKRTTLPWELNRNGLPWIEKDNQTDHPLDSWLALLVFTDDEAPNVKQETLKNLNLSDQFNHPEEVVNTIVVTKDQINKILPKPTVTNLKYLANLRKRTNVDESKVISERAYIHAGRLPKANTSHTVHLISLTDILPLPKQNASPNTERYKLISLHSWKFTCLEDKPSFKGLIENLDARAFRLYNQEAQGDRPIQNEYLLKGFVPMPHTMRKGLQSLSWYRGPLLPNKETINKPTSIAKGFSSDDYLRQDTNSQMLETSYAVAWQLGRMLTLKNKDVALDIQSFKRKIAQQIKSHHIISNTDSPAKHLKFLQQNTLTKHQKNIAKSLQSNDKTGLKINPSVSTWLNQLITLEVVPFINLVPNPEMLPLNTIRFFTLDPYWITSLLEGALSIGDERVQLSSSDFLHGNPSGTKFFSGFLLRSEVVGDYPDLHIAGYDKKASGTEKTEPSYHPIVTRKLSKELMLCIFEKEIKMVDFSLHREALHSGFGYDKKVLTKHVRNLTSGEESKALTLSYDIESGVITCNKKTIVNADRVLNILNLRTAFKDTLGLKKNITDPAIFSLQMMEGVPKVRIILE